MNNIQKIQFGEIFKRFRLKSEFKTLSQLGDSLAGLGLHYEDSLFSRWEHGSRIPKDRVVLISLIKLFAKRGGINNIQQANLLLEAAGHGYLTEGETESLPEKFATTSPFQVPREISYFTGREQYIVSIERKLLQGETVLIYGAAGCGKTALAIRLAHKLRKDFPDGILWLRLDTSSIMNILTSIAESYNEQILQVQDIQIYASYIRSLLSSKKVLLIFDNAVFDSRLDLLLPNSKSNSVIITSRSEDFRNLSIHERIYLQSFTRIEALSLFETILGNIFLADNMKDLLRISSLVGYLPLAVNLIAQQLLSIHLKPKDIIGELERKKLRLSDFIYENRNLYSAIKLSYDRLPQELKKFFISLSIFEGKDFSLDAVSYINKIDLIKSKQIVLELISNSLVEYSSDYRYRLHPVIKFFLKNQPVSIIFYKRSVIYYTNLLKKDKGKINYFSRIQPEIFNITHIFERFINKLEYDNSFFNLWREINSFLWFNGHWYDFLQINTKIHSSASRLNRSLLRLYASIDLSTAYYWLGDLDRAGRYAKECLTKANALNNKKFIAIAQDRLGKIYQLQHNFKRSSKNLCLALNYFKSTDDYERIGNILRHMGEGYLLMKDFDKAKVELTQSLKKYLQIRDPSVRTMYQALINSHLGVVFFKKNNFQDAEKLFILSLSFEKRAGGRAGSKIGSKLGLGLLYEIRGEEMKAEQYFKDAKKEIEILGIKKEIEKLVVCMSVLKEDLSKSKIYKKIF